MSFALFRARCFLLLCRYAFTMRVAYAVVVDDALVAAVFALARCRAAALQH